MEIRGNQQKGKVMIKTLHKIKWPNSLKKSPQWSRQLSQPTFRATRGSRVHLPRKENARSHHQRLFEENVRKNQKRVYEY